MNGTPIQLKIRERKILETWARSGRPGDRMALRSRIILDLAEGRKTSEVARNFSIRMATVTKWRTRFAKQGVQGLSDAPRSGKPPFYSHNTDDRVLYLLVQPPPKGHPRWNGRLLARALGNVSKDQIWRILRKRGIRLRGAAVRRRHTAL
jgi:transposase